MYSLPSEENYDSVTCVCFGAGRFLRCVFAPMVASLGDLIIAQPRGTSFCEYMKSCSENVYEMETVQHNGTVVVDTIKVAAFMSLGSKEGRASLMELAKSGRLPSLAYIGVGVTEAGIGPDTQAMIDLAEFLYALMPCKTTSTSLSIINTDNLPNNGDKIKSAIFSILDSHYKKALDAKELQKFRNFLNAKVSFHNSMVDRITSHRDGNAMVPRAEPLPLKSLVIEDLKNVLQDIPGMIVRKEAGQIEIDHMLKLRIANAIHSATVYCLALSRFPDTGSCANNKTLFSFIELLYKEDLSIVAHGQIPRQQADEVYRDWIQRLRHPHFGMSCLFVCQNALQKLGIRLMPAVKDVLKQGKAPSEAMAFAVACLLRFITPSSEPAPEIFEGVFACPSSEAPPPTGQDEGYAPGLSGNYATGKYTFRESFKPDVPRELMDISADSVESIVGRVLRGYLPGESSEQLNQFIFTVSQFFKRMYFEGAHPWTILTDIVNRSNPPPASAPRTKGLKRKHAAMQKEEKKEEDALFDIAEFVKEQVREVEAIDLHTHLFPPSHGGLMLWGIDALLTYHYLVAEFFMTATQITPESFFKLPQQKQADLVWRALFIERSPLSEAAKGVLTTLRILGLEKYVAARDLAGIRAWYAQQGQDLEQFVETVFSEAGVRYCVMTNVPFDLEEAQHWRPHAKEYSPRFRSALRVDPLLKGDWQAVKAALRAADYQQNLDGARRYLRDWADTMKPEYLMASTPHDFEVGDSPESQGTEDEPSGATLLEKVLIPTAEELNLPLALKLGAHRGVNPSLQAGGDGVKVMDVGVLRRLCARYPKVKFLATFLSRVNQHEACVLANKFPNLHIYGCWWYCNNPSIIEEITRMRIEMLGTGFTAQHSDARVLDQLLYKWCHSREIIGNVLAEEYTKLSQTGWRISKSDIARDVQRLFGGAYEDFMSKKNL